MTFEDDFPSLKDNITFIQQNIKSMSIDNKELVEQIMDEAFITIKQIKKQNKSSRQLEKHSRKNSEAI